MRKLPLFLVHEIVTAPDSPFTPTERLLAVEIGFHLDRQTGEGFPSVGRLAKRTGLSRRTVQRNLSGMVTKGLFVQTHGGGRHANTFRLVDPRETRATVAQVPAPPRRPSRATVAQVPAPPRRPSRAKKTPQQRHHDAAPAPLATAHTEELSMEQPMEESMSPARAAGTSPSVALVLTSPTNGHGAEKAIEVLAPNGWPSDWPDQVVQLWTPHGSVKHGHVGAVLKPLQGHHSFDDVLVGLRAYLAAGNARYGPSVFVSAAGDWISGRPGGRTTAGRDTAAAAQNWLRGGGAR